MATSQNFRSALNGFNREDVVRHLEYINTKHSTEMNQLRLENEALQSEINLLRSQPILTSENSEELEQLRQHVAQLEEENAALRAAAQTSVHADQAVTEPENAAAQAPAAVERTTEELEIYRRAERVEREARERAALLCKKVDSVLAETASKVDEAAAQISEMTDHVTGQITNLRMMVSSSKQVLHDAVACLSSIRPEEE